MGGDQWSWGKRPATVLVLVRTSLASNGDFASVVLQYTNLVKLLVTVFHQLPEVTVSLGTPNCS